MASTGILLGLLLIATVTDVTRHKIYNWTTYPGMLLGLGVGALTGGVAGFTESLSGLLVCGFVMLVCLVLFQVGGGDVKLMAMMGSLLGWQAGIEAMLWTFIIGALMAVAYLVWQIGAVHIFRKSVEHIGLVLKARRWVPLTTSERAPLRQGLFLAPAGLLAVCIVKRFLIPVP